MRHVVVLGSGPVGLTLANGLSHGSRVTVFSPQKPIRFESVRESDFQIDKDSNSGGVFGNSIYWGSQHEGLDPTCCEIPQFSDLAGFPFNLEELIRFESELVSQGWPNLTQRSPSKNRLFEPLRKSKFWKAHHSTTLPREIKEGVEIVLTKFDEIRFHFDSELKLDSIYLDGEIISADCFVLALGGLGNVAILQSAARNLNDLTLSGFKMLGKGYANHPKAKILRLNFHNYVRLQKINFSKKYQELNNFDLLKPSDFARPLRISARLWPEFSQSRILGTYFSRLLGKFGFYKSASVVVYFELPQLSSNSIKFLEKVDSKSTYSFRYNFPVQIHQYYLERLDELASIFAQNFRVKRVEKFIIDINEIIGLDANHHFGGTRMARSPEEGFVDQYGRSFFCPNLFVVGTSTLPVSSSLHPTLLCAALSLRTAQEISNS